MGDSRPIGITFVTSEHTNSIDSFWMMVKPGALLSPFDFVTVESIRNTTTIGIIKEIKRINMDSKILSKMLKPFSQKDFQYLNKTKHSGVTVAKVDVISNFHAKSNTSDGSIKRMDLQKARKKLNSPIINMPVEEGKTVHFANELEVKIALGIPQMIRPIPAGFIAMTDETKIPIDLDVTYIFGPDTTHVNATGISGNMKTSYLLFLLQIIHQKLLDEGISIIIFNTKEKDLLFLDQNRDENRVATDKEDFDLMGVDFLPFKNVSYFLPRGKNGKPNSAEIPQSENVKTYSYELTDVYDRLDLLFTSETTVDKEYNISSILDYIYESWPRLGQQRGRKNFDKKMNWSDLIDFRNYPEEILAHKSTLLQFQGMLRRFHKPATLFVDERVTSIYLGQEIKRMKNNHVIVIDIARLPTLEEQAFVVGDVIKTVNDMYSIGIVDDSRNIGEYSSLETKTHSTKKNYVPGKFDNEAELENKNKKSEKPKYVVILLDEINRFLPFNESSGNRHGSYLSNKSAVGNELLKTLLTGRSRHCILFSAQQFKSQIDPTINENTGLHIMTKLGMSELSTKPYAMVDDITKSVISKLHKGEFILVHSAFRHPIKITIPRPAFKKP